MVNIKFLDQTIVSYSVDGIISEGMGFASKEISIGEGMIGDGMIGEVEVSSGKGSVMSSWPFVIGITSGTFVISIVIGILLAKKRIKKGFDLYED